MHRKVVSHGRWMKRGLAGLALAGLALPAVGAFAEDKAAKLTAGQVQEARDLFMDWSCGACHVFADGEGYGQIGPAFDGNNQMVREIVIDRITNGQGAMMGFGGQLTDEQIALLSDYILQEKE